MEKTVTILTCAALLLGCVSASVQIMHPKELKNQFGSNGTVLSSLGNFGHIVYGSSTVRLIKFDLK
jgi:hypothetical protein